MLALIFKDPIVAAWIIFGSYFAVALLSARALRAAWAGARMSVDYPGQERRTKERTAAYRASFVFWSVIIVLFLFLGVNKQVDMQTWITMVGRRVAKAHGWYDQRTIVQAIFVLAIAITGLATLSVLLKCTRALLPRHVLAFFGLSVLAFYLLARASSFHDVEIAMFTEVLGMRVSWIIEMTGIVCVGVCAVLNYWWHLRLPATDAFAPPSSESARPPDAAEAGAAGA
jgi:hypothetical protein